MSRVAETRCDTLTVMRPWFVALLALSACGSDPRLRVDLRTDYVPRLEFVTVRTDIYADVDRSELELRAEFELSDAQSAFEGVRIADARVGSGIKTLVVSLLERTGATLAERVIVVDVRGDTGVTALLTRNCEGVACPASIAAATQCLGGQCVTPDCTPETPENCPEPVCTTADECPTGSSCTTHVRCRCMHVDANDGVRGPALRPERWVRGAAGRVRRKPDA